MKWKRKTYWIGFLVNFASENSVVPRETMLGLFCFTWNMSFVSEGLASLVVLVGIGLGTSGIFSLGLVLFARWRVGIRT